MSADFVGGATMAAALVIAVIFFRYSRQTATDSSSGLRSASRSSPPAA